ncbi:MAG TPA: Bax inhibitor-1/YccA family protein [Solirubrobacteraceae bacterium]|nr:Bax inhibitor-1/YccA family protein [Solirubrobacteraceae bacterium]
MEYSASTPPPYIDQRVAARPDVSFVRQVFGWMFGGLVVTGGVAALLSNTLSHEFLTKTGTPLFIAALILEVIVVIFLVAAINRISAAMATTAFMLYAALNGLTFAFIFAFYTTESVWTAFFVTAGMFGVMAVIGWTTSVDLSKLGVILIMALIGLILASIVNIFLASSTVYWITTYAGVLIFCGLTAYDMQKLKRLNTEQMTQEGRDKSAVIGALALYLDFIILFLFLLRIFGVSR